MSLSFEDQMTIQTEISNLEAKLAITDLKNDIPKGALVYTDLLIGLGDHSGIYVGDGKIVALSGKGKVEVVDYDKFTGGLTTVKRNIRLPVTISKGLTGSSLAAERALSKVGDQGDYNLLLDNCHQFCSGCYTGDFQNNDNFLWMLKDTVRKSLKEPFTVWLQWDWRSNPEEASTNTNSEE